MCSERSGDAQRVAYIQQRRSAYLIVLKNGPAQNSVALNSLMPDEFLSLIDLREVLLGVG